LERLMTGSYDAQELPRLRAEFAHLGAELRNWLCWPDPSGDWYALELGFWFRDTDEVHLVRVGSPAEMRERLRGFEEHAHAWQAARLAAGLPAADPPVRDLPLADPATFDVASLTAAMHHAANSLTPPEPLTARSVTGRRLPGWPTADPPCGMAACPGRCSSDGRERQRQCPGGGGPGRAQREHG
jgi:hypothetical protein